MGLMMSICEEIYSDQVIAGFGIRVVIREGGMGERMLTACKKYKAIYLHDIGRNRTIIL